MQFFACLLLCTALTCKNHIFSKSLKGRGGVQNVQNVQKVSRRCPEGVQKVSRRLLVKMQPFNPSPFEKASSPPLA